MLKRLRLVAPLLAAFLPLQCVMSQEWEETIFPDPEPQSFFVVAAKASTIARMQNETPDPKRPGQFNPFVMWDPTVPGAFAMVEYNMVSVHKRVVVLGERRSINTGDTINVLRRAVVNLLIRKCRSTEAKYPRINLCLTNPRRAANIRVRILDHIHSPPACGKDERRMRSKDQNVWVSTTTVGHSMKTPLQPLGHPLHMHQIDPLVRAGLGIGIDRAKKDPARAWSVTRAIHDANRRLSGNNASGLHPGSPLNEQEDIVEKHRIPKVGCFFKRKPKPVGPPQQQQPPPAAWPPCLPPARPGIPGGGFVRDGCVTPAPTQVPTLTPPQMPTAVGSETPVGVITPEPTETPQVARTLATATAVL